MLSMTGHGRASIRQGNLDIEVHIRSVNHRFFNLKLSLHEGVASQEAEIEKITRERIRRGSVSVAVDVKKTGGSGRSLPDPDTVRAVYQGLKKIQKSLKIPGEVTMQSLLGLPHLWVQDGRSNNLAGLWPRIRTVLQKALDDHGHMREREGRGINQFLNARLKLIETHLAKILKRAPQVTALYQKKLLDRVNALASEKGIQLASRDLAREVAIFADRSDISEEAQRIASHCRQFRKIFKQSGPIGRKMDFLTQELVREANTLAAKGSDSGISALAVEIKSEIEKIKEQVENVE